MSKRSAFFDLDEEFADSSDVSDAESDVKRPKTFFITSDYTSKEHEKDALPNVDEAMSNAMKTVGHKTESEIDWHTLSKTESASNSHAVPPPDDLQMREHTLGQEDYKYVAHSTKPISEKRPFESKK